MKEWLGFGEEEDENSSSRPQLQHSSQTVLKKRILSLISGRGSMYSNHPKGKGLDFRPSTLDQSHEVVFVSMI